MRIGSLLLGISVFLLLVTCGAKAFAETAQMYGVVSGVSHHFNAGGFNTRFSDSNPGGGVEVEGYTSPAKNFLWFASGGEYRNSIRQTSHWAGIGLKWRFQFSERFDQPRLEVGAIAGGLDGYEFNNGGLFPVALPLVSLGVRHMIVDTIIIPPLPGMTPLTIGFQLRIQIIRW